MYKRNMRMNVLQRIKTVKYYAKAASIIYLVLGTPVRFKPNTLLRTILTNFSRKTNVRTNYDK